MSRGKNLNLQPDQVVKRALSQLYYQPAKPPGAPDDWVPTFIQYRLDEKNGGRDPDSIHCADWSFGNRVPTSDCVGFALWAAGIDRLQPGYSGSRGEWLNCDSIIDDAHGPGQFFKPVSSAAGRPGDMLVSPADYSGIGSHGHIGVILSYHFEPGQTTKCLVLDCSPSHAHYTSIPIAQSVGAVGTRLSPWSTKCQVIRPKWYL